MGGEETFCSPMIRSQSVSPSWVFSFPPGSVRPWENTSQLGSGKMVSLEGRTCENRDLEVFYNGSFPSHSVGSTRGLFL